MPTTSKRKTAKKPKKVVVASTGLPPADMSNRRRASTPRIVEVPEDSDEVLDWGSSDEIAEVANNRFTMRLTYPIDCSQSVVYCRKDIA